MRETRKEKEGKRSTDFFKTFKAVGCVYSYLLSGVLYIRRLLCICLIQHTARKAFGASYCAWHIAGNSTTAAIESQRKPHFITGACGGVPKREKAS